MTNETNQERTIAPALPSASILVVRDGKTGLEVLMMERAKTMRFAPGAFVFPGGKVDAEDMKLWRWRGQVSDLRMNKETSYKIAALRELFEEVGVCHATGSRHKAVISNSKMAIARKSGNEFRRMLVKQGLVLDTKSLEPFAHWVTPENLPRRFDTYFYIAHHKGQKAKHDGNEAISHRWVNPQKLLDSWEGDQVPLMFPTRLNLVKLARAKTAREAVRMARQTPIVKTLPVMSVNEGKPQVTITNHAEYGNITATERELRTERPK
ncbi:NUDIX domain-containing protein [Kordiimonas sp. SCSIO 12610]|uniref:NUDIX hydrolase n=1 Tax=Kordiimonas sp. SCSIO 12610 TaxID=2829597 RepID=UPI00210D8A87|nr:NUDIX domain-containing protein [Kordiimonas sp. SCSIO 12610]UTW54057.1 NUDIX domain-containing protein [Kordiimonas sp. SCSIO 12610]